MKFLKRLFCKHDYKAVSPKFVINDEILAVYECKKCGEMVIM